MRLAVLAVLLLASCGGPPAWWEVDATKLDPPDVARLERARNAAVLLGERLFTKLSEKVAAGGLASAVDVCRTAAPPIAAELGAELGLRIGRTSSRLRNPDNEAPKWVATVVAGPEESAGRSRVFLSDDGAMGVTLPVRMKAMCLSCHGAPEKLDPAAQERISSLYPGDRATGYADGDLRGLVWVELPREE
jgi:hypothetical protein